MVKRFFRVFQCFGYWILRGMVFKEVIGVCFFFLERVETCLFGDGLGAGCVNFENFGKNFLFYWLYSFMFLRFLVVGSLYFLFYVFFSFRVYFQRRFVFRGDQIVGSWKSFGRILVVFLVFCFCSVWCELGGFIYRWGVLLFFFFYRFYLSGIFSDRYINGFYMLFVVKYSRFWGFFFSFWEVMLL